MILVITHKQDFTADFIINKLNRRQIDYKRLNCEDIYNSNSSIKIGKAFSHKVLGEEHYRSVWFRRTKFPEITDLRPEEKLYILTETEALFKNMFSTLRANWISKPSAVYEAENKAFQLQTAKEVGFSVPPTLITTSKQELTLFFNENNKDIILKPLSQTRIPYPEGQQFIFTSAINKRLIDNLDNFDLTPCIFQKRIEKEYEIRVTVVGDKVFPAAVYSQQDQETLLDWRRKKLNFHSVKIPEQIQELCVALVRVLGLQFGAIDLIKTPDSDYIFLEINPNGQWVWIENQTDHKISDALIHHLLLEP